MPGSAVCVASGCVPVLVGADTNANFVSPGAIENCPHVTLHRRRLHQRYGPEWVEMVVGRGKELWDDIVGVVVVTAILDMNEESKGSRRARSMA